MMYCCARSSVWGHCIALSLRGGGLPDEACSPPHCCRWQGLQPLLYAGLGQRGCHATVVSLLCHLVSVPSTAQAKSSGFTALMGHARGTVPPWCELLQLVVALLPWLCAVPAQLISCERDGGGAVAAVAAGEKVEDSSALGTPEQRRVARLVARRCFDSSAEMRREYECAAERKVDHDHPDLEPGRTRQCLEAIGSVLQQYAEAGCGSADAVIAAACPSIGAALSCQAATVSAGSAPRVFRTLVTMVSQDDRRPTVQTCDCRTVLEILMAVVQAMKPVSGATHGCQAVATLLQRLALAVGAEHPLALRVLEAYMAKFVVVA